MLRLLLLLVSLIPIPSLAAVDLVPVFEAQVPVDDRISALSIVVVFPPDRSDRTYARLEDTGGIAFELGANELSLLSSLVNATSERDRILGRDVRLAPARSRALSVVAPGGKEMASKVRWSNGALFDEKDPKRGTWKIRIEGSGECRVKVFAETSLNLSDAYFGSISSGPHPGFFPLESVRRGSRQVLAVEFFQQAIDENADRSAETALTGLFLSPDGRELSRFALAEQDRRSFIAEVEVPNEPFRVGVLGPDRPDPQWRREHDSVFEPSDVGADLPESQREAIQKGLGAAAAYRAALPELRTIVHGVKEAIDDQGLPIGVDVDLELYVPATLIDSHYLRAQALIADGRLRVDLLPRPWPDHRRDAAIDERRVIRFEPSFIRHEKTGPCLFMGDDLEEAIASSGFVAYSLDTGNGKPVIPLSGRFSAARWLASTRTLGWKHCDYGNASKNDR